MAFEKESSIPLSQYWQMIEGKTATLLSTCFKIGAIVAGVNELTQKAMSEVGKVLGLAFQIQDDFLGIWGEEKYTGKSIYSDLISRKKTYPVVLGLMENQEFASLWLKSEKFNIDLAMEMANWLEVEGIRERVVKEYKNKYSKVHEILDGLPVDNKKLMVLEQVIYEIENRVR